MKKKIFCAAVGQIFIASVTLQAFAGMVSLNYDVKTTVLSGSAGFMNSASYKSIITVDQPCPLMDSANPPSSTNYHIYPGFLYTVGSNDQDSDNDGYNDLIDNCPATPNGPTLGTCTAGSFGDSCMSNQDCGTNGFCSMNQEDTDEDGIGDACDSSSCAPSGSLWCGGNFDAADCCSNKCGIPYPPDGNTISCIDDMSELGPGACDWGWGWYSANGVIDRTNNKICCNGVPQNVADCDNDGVLDLNDNCSVVPNGPSLGTCDPGSEKTGLQCTRDIECTTCTTPGFCSMGQEDGDSDGVGDVCDN